MWLSASETLRKGMTRSPEKEESVWVGCECVCMCVYVSGVRGHVALRLA